MTLDPTRISRLPENTLIKRISDLESFVNQLNSTYQQLGSHSLVTSRLYSANTYDIEVDNITTAALTTPVVVQVTFTPSSTLFNDLSLVHFFAYTYTSSGSPFPVLERLLPSNNLQQWNIPIWNSSGSTIAWTRLKFYFFVVGSGTFTANVLP
jgi:hypothetical protein